MRKYFKTISTATAVACQLFFDKEYEGDRGREKRGKSLENPWPHFDIQTITASSFSSQNSAQSLLWKYFELNENKEKFCFQVQKLFCNVKKGRINTHVW